MNIGIVTTWFERGAGYVSKAYVKTLASRYKVFVYARGGEKYGKRDPNWDLPYVTYSPRWHNPLFKFDSAMCRTHFWRWVKHNRIDLILFNEQRHVGLVKEIKSCGIICGAYVDYYTRSTIKDFDVYDFLICNTHRHYSVFRDHENVFYIPWGTDTHLFSPPPSRVSFEDGVVFFHSAGYGSINSRKGTDLLVQAFQKVKGIARLIIHSQSPVQNYGGEIAKLIISDKRIVFINKVVSAPGLYYMGHVYVYPSRLDGIGLTVPEALAVGLPAITTDCAPMNEFVEDGYNGLLVKVAQISERWDGYYWPHTIVDIDDLAHKMQAYVNDRGLLLKHSSNARRSAIERFDWSKNSQELTDSLSCFACQSHRIKCRPARSISWILRDFLVLSTYLLTLPAAKLLYSAPVSRWWQARKQVHMKKSLILV